MRNEKLLDIINKIVSKQTFKYSGEIIGGTEMNADIDYKFRISGYKKMISVGEEYDYMMADVTIIGLNDRLSKVLFGFDEKTKHLNLDKAFVTQLYPFYSNLSNDIRNYVKYFDSEARVTINDLKFDLKTPENITESRMSKVAVRTTVTDIVHILKKGEEGEFRLPNVDDGDEYSFTNLPFGYSVDLSVEIDENMDGYEIEGTYSSEDDVIEIAILFNPNTLRRNFYDIIGKLNDIVAHELEHGFQYSKGERVYSKPPKTSFKYYTQPHEITAQRVGFRRVAKLRKLPFNDVVRDWFEDHRDIHQLTDKEMEEVIKIIIDGK